MLVPLHIATLVLVALLLVTLAVWQLVERPTGQWFRLVSSDDAELSPLPIGQRSLWDVPETWQLCNARRGSPAAPVRAQTGRSSRVGRRL